MKSCGPNTRPPNPGDSSGRTIQITVGTAGHIDHGKTSLVKWLTGCDTDRLPEEKARGMTIDLGFAPCELPNGHRVGIVDVPGHERFVHNMVAGVTGIDVVLLVVAADDGVMPQTIEHYHIVRLLGVRRGLVALTKIDLVAPPRIPEVTAQIRELVRGGFLEGAPIIPVSTKTGEGYESFYNAFSALVDETAERDAGGPFRLHVERVFVLKGHGVILSGIPRSGSTRVGDFLELLPGNSLKRVRGVQVYGQNIDMARAGECVALKMADLASDEAGRGSVLATPGFFEASRFVNARFQLLRESGKPLEPRTPIRFHVGTSDVPGHLILPTLNRLAPGSESYVQIQLQEPVVAAPGDPFVARSLSPTFTLGGGYVVGLDPKRIRRSKGCWIEACEEHDHAFREPQTALEYVLRHAAPRSMRLAEAAHVALIDEKMAGEHMNQLVKKGIAIGLESDRFAHAQALEETAQRITQNLNRFHDESPMSGGFGKTAIFSATNLEKPIMEKAMSDLLERKNITCRNSLYALAGRAPALSAEDSSTAEAIIQIYEKTGFSSPRPDELPEQLNKPAARIEPVLKLLIQNGDLVRLSDKVILHRKNLNESKRKLIEHLQKNGKTDATAFKDVLGTTRKYAIPILEYWDKQGVTRRIGDIRTLIASHETA